MKMWWTVGMESVIEWPREPMVVRYAGRAIHLLPGGKKLLHDHVTAPTVGVAYEEPGPYLPPHLETLKGEPRCKNREEAILVIKRFLSVLSWCTEYAITEHGECGGSLSPTYERRPPRGGGTGQIFEYYADCLPEAPTDEGRVALAFYREGLSVDSLPYQFLCFAKVLNLRLRDSLAQKSWINSHLDVVVEPYARLRIDALRAKGEDIGDYLYTSGCCAVAHAIGEPRVDPDDPEDLHRLHEDLPLIRALARHFIIIELGVKTLAMMADERSAARRRMYEQLE